VLGKAKRFPPLSRYNPSIIQALHKFAPAQRMPLDFRPALAQYKGRLLPFIPTRIAHQRLLGWRSACGHRRFSRLATVGGKATIGQVQQY